jgi:hypothetical protein
MSIAVGLGVGADGAVRAKFTTTWMAASVADWLGVPEAMSVTTAQ